MAALMEGMDQSRGCCAADRPIALMLTCVVGDRDVRMAGGGIAQRIVGSRNPLMLSGRPAPTWFSAGSSMLCFIRLPGLRTLAP